jgi:hypothetical protein
MPIDAPIRGLRNVEGSLFVVSGNQLYRVDGGGIATEVGTVPGLDRVSIDYNQVANGNQVAIDNGFSRYVFNTADNSFAQVTDDQFPGSFVAEFLDGYILGVEPFGRYWFWSDLADALSYSSFDRAQAEARPDPIQALKVFNREVWVFGRDTTEVFVNTGALNGTFQRAGSTVLNVGCAGRFAVARSNAGLFWLGGDGRMYSAQGYNPAPISTPPVEQAIRGLDWSQCFAFTWEDEGHSVVYFGFPNGVTFGFDASTGLWHRRESQGLPGWRIGHLERWDGKWIAGDIYGGGLYELAWDAYDEAGSDLVCTRTSGVFSDAQNLLVFSGLELVMDTGSRDTQQKAVLQYSDDGGRNWTNWREGSMGALGAYAQRIRFHRLGSSRARVWRIRCSDPRRRDLLSASVTVESAG